VSVETTRAVLVAAAGVTAIVGTGANARISPLIKAQGITPPAVTLQRVAMTPQNHLRGNGSLDYCRVQSDSWAVTYAAVRALADACRAAMEAAGHPLLSEIDNYDPEVDPGLYRITQDYQVWD
jgi:hypothetical protein